MIQRAFLELISSATCGRLRCSPTAAKSGFKFAMARSQMAVSTPLLVLSIRPAAYPSQLDRDLHNERSAAIPRRGLSRDVQIPRSLLRARGGRKGALAAVLSDIQIISDDPLPSDPATWNDWLDAIISVVEERTCWGVTAAVTNRELSDQFGAGTTHSPRAWWASASHDGASDLLQLEGFTLPGGVLGRSPLPQCQKKRRPSTPLAVGRTRTRSRPAVAAAEQAETGEGGSEDRQASRVWCHDRWRRAQAGRLLQRKIGRIAGAGVVVRHKLRAVYGAGGAGQSNL